MLVGVVALHCVVLITECYNSHKHGQSPLTRQEILDSTGTETRQIFFRMSVKGNFVLKSCLSLLKIE